MSTTFTKVCLSLFASIFVALLSHAAAGPVTPVDWNNPNSGILGGINVSLTGLSTAFPPNPLIIPSQAFTNSNYSAAPIASAEAVQYGAADDWTLTLSQPVSGLLLYAVAWRGNYTSNPDPTTTYTFSQPFTILSGFSGASVIGNTLLCPDGSFFSGIIQFSGSISSLSVISDGGPSGQAMTFAAALPESLSPLAALSGSCTGLLVLWRYRRRRV